MDGLSKFTSGIRTRFFSRGMRGAEPATPIPDPTPIYVSSNVRLLILFLIGVGLYIIARDAPTVVSLLLIGSTVALVLSFPIRLLSRFMARRLAIAIVALSTALFAILLLAVIIPFAITEISRFAENLPSTIEQLQDLTRDVLFQFYERGWIHQHPDLVLEDIQAGLFDAGQRIVTDVLTNTVDWLTRSVSLLITTFGVIFVAIYLLIDIPRFKDSFVRMWAPDYRDDALVLWDTIGNSLSRYLGGLLISIIIQGVAAFIGLTILGVPYAVLLGVWMAITAVLPYIGAFMGGIPPVIIALTISWELAVATVILYIIINQIEANFITPPIQGSAVRVHPLMIFFSVFAGSAIFGVIGAVMAVPALAVLRVLGEFFWLRLQLREDHPTLLAAMRADTVSERIVHEAPPIPPLIEEPTEDREPDEDDGARTPPLV